MNIRAGLFSLSVVSVIIIAVVLGCGRANPEACNATVDYLGKPFEGKGATEFEAKSSSCNNYCRDADPEYQARYDIWIDSAKGRNAGSPSKQNAISKDKDLMEFVTKTCNRVCLTRMNPTVSCN